MRERDGKWEDPECFLKAMGQADCDGTMSLKDVTISEGSFDMIIDCGQTFPEYSPPILEKTWVCNKCGFIFYE